MFDDIEEGIGDPQVAAVAVLADAVQDCQDKGMTYDEIDEVVRSTMEANAPKYKP